jgi:hypothetical protein
MNANEVSKVQLYLLTLTLIAGEWSMSHASCFTPHKDPVHTVQDNWWAAQQAWKGVGVYENISEHSLGAYLSKLFAQMPCTKYMLNTGFQNIKKISKQS